jgi:hypothetical protein
MEDDKAGKKPRQRTFRLEDMAVEEVPDPPGTLGSRLNDLGKELLQVY